MLQGFRIQPQHVHWHFQPGCERPSPGLSVFEQPRTAARGGQVGGHQPTSTRQPGHRGNAERFEYDSVRRRPARSIQWTEATLGVPGIGLWALVHTYTGFCLSLFMVVHVYLGTTGASLGELFRFMWFGEPDPSQPSPARAQEFPEKSSANSATSAHAEVAVLKKEDS